MPKPDLKKLTMRQLKETDELEQNAAKIRSEYIVGNRDEKEGLMKAKSATAPADELRARILSMSLFPNVFSASKLQG
jgi:hypothetical protein